MNPEDRDRTSEILIDEALARHSRVEPRPGLERRILARLADRKPPFQWPRWTWAFASVALIAAAVLVVILFHGPQIRKNAAQAALEKPASPVPPTAPPPQPPVKANTSLRSMRAVVPTIAVDAGLPQPRLAQFPSPAPLSEEEQLLLRFVTQHHDEAVQFAKNQNQPLEDLKIEDIKIAPLAEDSKPNSDEDR